MAAITVAKYQTIANLYGNAETQIAGVTDYYYDAAYEIVILQTFDPERDLLQPFYNAYLASSKTLVLKYTKYSNKVKNKILYSSFLYHLSLI